MVQNIQTVFETKQKAEELYNKAVEIWRNSDLSDYLEGIEKDPVFSLLITALAYQANETEAEIQQLKMSLLEEFASLQAPFEIGHAIPATAVVETGLQDHVSDIELTPNHVFTLGYNGAEFMPLLQTRVLNAAIQTVTRLDGRRWQVDIAFKSPIDDLSGFTFAILNQHYRDLRVTLDGTPVALTNPWDYSELPLSPCFALDTMIYNKAQTYTASALCLDLFARQNVRMYCVKPYQPKKLLPYETEHLELVFEFFGIGDEFVLDKDSLSLNTVVLVNARQQTANLSTANPIVRAVGYNLQEDDPKMAGQQFLHMLRPSEDQLYGNMQIEVRRMSADRYNQGQLLQALNHMLSKYYSDYYAFMQINKTATDKVMNALAQTLQRLADAAKAQDVNSIPGVYLMLRPTDSQRQEQASMDLTYVTTSGAAVNDALDEDARFIPPSGFDANATHQIATPIPGFDEIRDERATARMTRYYMATNDRLVTPADIKLFCIHQLTAHYGIVREMVKSLTVSHRQQFDYHQCGYEILVEIIMADNSFVRRSLEEHQHSAEMMLEKMIEVRSTNIYPVRVSIQIESGNH